MKNKIITAVFVSCLLLVGCGNTDTSTKQETETVTTEDTEVTDNTNTETNITTEETEETEQAEEVTPNIIVREEQGGYLEETQISEDKSSYRIIWGGDGYVGENIYATFSFDSIPNIGSWTEESTDPGVYRYIYNDQWFTVAIWSYGGIVDEDGKDISLNILSPETIAGLFPMYVAKQETVEVKTFDDKYMTATIDFETTQGLKGTAVVVDDFDIGFRYVVQFLVLDNAEGTLARDTADTLVPSNFEIEEFQNEYEQLKDADATIITPDMLNTVDGTPDVDGANNTEESNNTEILEE